MLLAKMSVVEGERLARRRSLAEGTTLRVDNKPSAVEVLNLSTTGCMIRSGIKLEPGMTVRIGLQGLGSYEAEVIRSDGVEVGCQFHLPLRQDEVDLAFTKNVLMSGNWDVISTSAEVVASDKSLSPLAKLTTIVGLSVGLWAAITAAAYYYI